MAVTVRVNGDICFLPSFKHSFHVYLSFLLAALWVSIWESPTALHSSAPRVQRCQEPQRYVRQKKAFRIHNLLSQVGDMHICKDYLPNKQETNTIYYRRPMDYVNTSHNPDMCREWESIEPESEMKLCYLFLLISPPVCDVLIVGINLCNLG